jgi:isopenicillin-N epimerase
MPALRYGQPQLRRFLLERGAVYLNHGSFGATPRVVLAAQDRWRARMERQPARFMTETLPRALRRAADELADFLGTGGERLAFVDNATTAVNTVLRSYPWKRGDELILSDHAYPAVANAARHAARLAGVAVREVELPFPVRDEHDLVRPFCAAAGPRTRMAIVDHVSSKSALVLPLAAICAALRKRGVSVLVDGAHAPGMLALQLDALDADWYAGNCHKWLFAPKGCGFLWAAPQRQAELVPLVISNLHGAGFPGEFDWTGTRDPSACLALGAALGFYRELGGAALRARNHRLALAAARMLARAWKIELPAPATLLGSMASLPLPLRGQSSEQAALALNRALWKRHRIEVPVFVLGGRLHVRISAQAYNQPSDYERLAAAVLEIAPAWERLAESTFAVK